MFAYIVKRIFLIILSMLIVLGFTYIVLSVSQILTWTRLTFNEALTYSWLSFKSYFMGIVTEWDFGVSMDGVDVWQLIGKKLLITMKYNFTALFIYTFFWHSLWCHSCSK